MSLPQQEQSVSSSSSCFSRCIRPYQAAVALSNMGVTLIERQLYADAVITIRDALFIIRAHADPERESDIKKNNALPTDLDIQCMINRATNCLLYHSLSNFDTSKSNSIKLTIVSDCQGNIQDILSAVNEAEAYVVRIDDTINPVEDFSSAYIIHSKACAILLNYGTACQCLYHVQRGIMKSSSDNDAGSLDILHEAMAFLKISHRILIRQTEPIMRHFYHKQLAVKEMEANRTLTLTVLVLHALVNVCSKLGEMDNVWSYRNDFDSVCKVIASLQYAQYWKYNQTAPSA
jgi:hypothetical protein